jgi:putative transposase
VPTHLKRYYGNHHLHFLTCSCYHRQAWMGSARRRDLFLHVFEQVRKRYRFVVVGYVVMPEHIHLLIAEPEKGDPSKVMQAVKQGFARRVLKENRRRRRLGQEELFGTEPEHVWQARFYDFNVWSQQKRVEKLRYMHDNPVRRGLVAAPEQWAWSSYRAYAFGEAGVVKLNDWPLAILKKKQGAA